MKNRACMTRLHDGMISRQAIIHHPSSIANVSRRKVLQYTRPVHTYGIPVKLPGPFEPTLPYRGRPDGKVSAHVCARLRCSLHPPSSISHFFVPSPVSILEGGNRPGPPAFRHHHHHHHHRDDDDICRHHVVVSRLIKTFIMSCSALS